jgi:hypothetical protein
MSIRKLVVFALAGLIPLAWAGVSQANGTAYYVDCAGNDANDGLTPATAWLTLAKAQAALLQPGDSLLFQRGCVWEGAGPNLFTAAWNGAPGAPITLGAYGEGANPVFQLNAGFTDGTKRILDLTGSYLAVSDLSLVTINPKLDPGCVRSDGTGVPYGFNVGANLPGHHLTLTNIEVKGGALGFNFSDASHDNRILYAYVHTLETLWRYTAPGTMGALGVNLHGNDHEIAYGRFEDNWAECTRVADGVYQSYSAPFEIFNANRSYIHHNTALEHRKTAEYGKGAAFTSDGNIFAYNLIVSSRVNGRGPNIHGNDEYGPVTNTWLDHNTIVLTGKDSQALIAGSSGVASSNLLIAEGKAIYYAATMALSGNLYWDYRNFADTAFDPCVQRAGGGCLPLDQVNDADPMLDSTYGLTAASPDYNVGAFPYGPPAPTATSTAPTLTFEPTLTLTPTFMPEPTTAEPALTQTPTLMPEPTTAEPALTLTPTWMPPPTTEPPTLEPTLTLPPTFTPVPTTAVPTLAPTVAPTATSTIAPAPTRTPTPRGRRCPKCTPSAP